MKDSDGVRCQVRLRALTLLYGDAGEPLRAAALLWFPPVRKGDDRDVPREVAGKRAAI
jgi:hypothetical protein